MPLSKVRDFLDAYNIPYLILSHPLAYTAQGTAALTHISGKELAKTVIVRIDGELAMAVVPASRHVDLPLLKRALGAQVVELASEPEFQGRFLDCETGAMPPFGNLYGMSVYADESLASDQEITFNAGTHRQLLRMDWADLVKLVEPRILQITKERVAEFVA
ncbi:MAG: YbaK/EbsC family protein [Candidatus Sulfotelmatobacter sp.]